MQRPGAPKSPDSAPDTLRSVALHGAASVVVPVGEDAVSDPVPLRVPTDANLLVGLYTSADSDPATYHRSALQTSFIAPDGDRTADADGTSYTTTTGSWYYLTGVDVLHAPAAGSVVALGDSITDGSGSTASAGVNDIKGSPNQTDPAAFEAAFREIVTRAHAHGIRVIGGTITPYGGNRGWSTAREAVRQYVNDLIRYGGIFDTVTDFDAVVRDPAAPDRILPAHDSGDHLHFNDISLQAMADAAGLTLLIGNGSTR
ncbi:GDSL-type esterase/lipase family protein [Streptomyces cylindrosporus]|uniref:GDSL-type esterase/lipase family protein n=1 Tax=Streptomyces cylindrosporus TaxID=2927583 RepID=UPI0027E26A60|nr:GDSL-type esterase/lipase family protein [Streptomyces cylindrosporus]